MFSISVIIPTYNGRNLLKKNLPSVLNALRNQHVDYEIIVVDDASDDNTKEFLQFNYPKIIVLENNKNLGFSKTMNIGIQKATKQLVLALNNDIRLPDDFFLSIREIFWQDDVFSVSCTMKDAENKKTIEAAKRPVSHIGKAVYDDVETNEDVYTLFASGGCALYNRNKLLQLNGFDEIFSPFYYEDVDLGLRAWLQGWKSIYTPRTYFFHDRSATIKTTFEKKFIRKIISRNILIIRYLYTTKTRVYLFFVYLIYQFILSFILIFLNRNRAFFLCAVDFFLIFWLLKKKKKGIKNSK